jgi:hypothetical protein
MATVTDQFVKDALLVIWDILGDLNVDDDDDITKKRDQLRKVLSAIDVPKSTAKKARAIVDAQLPDATVDV